MKRSGKTASHRGLLLSVSFMSGLALLIILQRGAEEFLSHPLFLVREVEVQWVGGVAQPRPTHFRLSPPASIFRVDLGSLSQAFRQKYPLAEVERMDCVLPNRIVAALRPRQIVAQLRLLRKYYPISENGRMVGTASDRALVNLPVLSLEGMRADPLTVGTDLSRQGFWKVSDILAAVQRDRGIAGKPVREVRLQGEDLFVVLESGTELRFSSDELGEGWQRLWELISQRHSLLEEARYVDLRFEDPVIANRNQRVTSR